MTKDTKKVVRSVTMKVYEDDSTEFVFTGVDGWPIGRMQRQLERAGRHLKSEQRQISHQNDLRLKAEEEARDAAVIAQKAVTTDIDNVSSMLKERATEGDNLTLADILKAQLDKLGEAGVNSDANDTGTDGSNAGEAG